MWLISTLRRWEYSSSMRNSDHLPPEHTKSTCDYRKPFGVRVTARVGQVLDG